jgi:anti-anti-sigma factor
VASFEIGESFLRVTGALDPDSENSLRGSCRRALEGKSETVTLDLTGVDYINSISIGMLVALCMDLRASGRRAVLQPSKQVKKVLDMTGLTETFAAAAKPVEKPAPDAAEKSEQQSAEEPTAPRSRSKKAQF